MKKRNWLGDILLCFLVVTILIVKSPPFVAAREPKKPFDWDIDQEQLERLKTLWPYFLTIQSVIATVNSILLGSLFTTYFDIYRKTGTKFSLGLVIFSLALLLYSITSNPIINRFIGFKRIGFGVLLLIPDMFTSIASAILIYLSRQ